MALQAGDPAPDFTKVDQSGEQVSLAGVLQERPAFLVFYPFTFTSVCEGELCTLRDDWSMYTDRGVQVLSMSCDAAPTQKRWAGEMGYQFPGAVGLLAAR